MPIDRVVGQVPPALVELALWIAAYYGSTPARALALVAPELPKRRKEQAPPAERQSFGGEAEPDELLPEQRVATDRIVSAIDAGSGGAFLLYGPTGSGKTEVYLQACAAVLERGLGAILLVPEISLAPQTVGRVHARFGDRVAILHSGLTDAERRDERVRIASGEARIVVGARSADLRAGSRARADRGRRGARGVVQAGLGSAVRRADGCGQARRARGGRRRVRLRDAAPRELGGARAPRAGRPGRRRPAAGQGRRHAPRGGVPAVGAAARRAPAGARVEREGDAAAQPPRDRAGAPLPGLRRHDPLPELRRRARAAPRRRAARVTTAATSSRPRRPAPRAAPPSSRGSAPARSGSSASSRASSPVSS